MVPLPAGDLPARHGSSRAWLGGSIGIDDGIGIKFGIGTRAELGYAGAKRKPMRTSGTRTLFRLVALAATATATAGCVTWQPAEPRPPRALDPGHLEELTPRHGAWGLRLEIADDEAHWRRYVFSFETYDDAGGFRTVRGDWYVPTVALESPAPLIVLAPILAGPVDDYLASRFIARAACRRGISAFFVHQETVILDGDRDSLALEERLAQNIRDNRKAIALFLERPEVDSTRLGSFGVSLGAIKNVALIASEPRLEGNVLVLAGADLAGIVLESREHLVEQYLEGRWIADGLEPDEVSREIDRWFVSEPAVLASAIDPRRVHLFLGRFDDKVPFGAGISLYCALGEPATTVASVGHYTAIVVAPWWIDLAFHFLAERWRTARLRKFERLRAEAESSVTRRGLRRFYAGQVLSLEPTNGYDSKSHRIPHRVDEVSFGVCKDVPPGTSDRRPSPAMSGREKLEEAI